MRGYCTAHRYRRLPALPFRVNSHLAAVAVFWCFNCPKPCYNSHMQMPIQSNGETFFTTQEAASYLGFAEDTMRRYVYRGLIASRKLGNMRLFSKSECDRYKREKRQPGRQKNNF
jgi:excisionase family DNA binding protein